MSGWAAAAAAAMDVANTAFGAWQSSKAARRQIAWQKEQYHNRYQWTVEDMRKAGLNPVLASMNGVSSAGGIAAEPASSSIGQNLGRHLMTKQQEAEIQNTEANSGKAIAETETQEVMQRLLTAQEKGVLADTALKSVNAARQQMELDYWRQHPDVYDAVMSYKGGQLLQGARALQAVFGGSGNNSAKGFRYEDK